MNLERDIELKHAVAAFVIIAVILVLIGFFVGNAFFWNKYDTIDPTDKDIAYYKTLLAKEPKNDAYLVELGWLYYRRQENQKALEALKSAININPQSVKAHYNLGLTLQELKMFAEAENEFKKAISLNPNDPLFYRSLGKLFIAEEHYEPAVKELEQAIKLDPISADNYYYMGFAYEKNGYKEEAKSAYEQAIKLVPEYKDARDGYNRVLRSK